MRNFIIILLIQILAASTFAEKPILQTAKPNILLFVGDDWTWSDNEAYGNSDVKTPNIKQLAEEGMCFDNMFTSTAMCSPTRQQLYTGLFPARSGGYPNHSFVYDGVKSLGHHFKALGYRVALIGKTHYGPDASYPIEYLGGRHHDNGKNGGDIPMEKIESIVAAEQPFFLIIAQNQPHTPWNRGNPEAYDKDAISIPEYMVDCEETRKGIVKYYAEITYADSLLGYCLNTIKNAGKKNSTVSIFTSEQGYTYPFGKWTCYDLGLKTAFIISWPGKIKSGTRNSAFTQYVDVVPTLLDLIGENPNNIDVGIADTYGNRGFDGISFSNVVWGKSDEHRKYTYGMHTTRGIHAGSKTYPIRSVRSDKYKYIQNLSFESDFNNVNTKAKKGIYYTWLNEEKDSLKLDWLKTYKNRPYEELYDLENDPYEMNNLANNKELKEVKLKLRTELENWMKQQGDLGVGTEMKANEQKNH